MSTLVKAEANGAQDGQKILVIVPDNQKVPA